MSVFRKSGLARKPTGVYHALALALKEVNLTPVQRVSYKFDPFHENANAVRELMRFLSTPRIRETNYKTTFKTNVVCDRSEPEIECQLGKEKRKSFKIIFELSIE